MTTREFMEASKNQAQAFQAAAAARSAAYRKLANTHPRGTARDAYLMLSEASLLEVNGFEYVIAYLKKCAESKE